MKNVQEDKDVIVENCEDCKECGITPIGANFGDCKTCKDCREVEQDAPSDEEQIKKEIGKDYVKTVGGEHGK